MDLNILLILIAVAFAFLVLREVVCWYWKINKSVYIQQKILNELVKLNKGRNK